MEVGGSSADQSVGARGRALAWRITDSSAWRQLREKEENILDCPKQNEDDN